MELNCAVPTPINISDITTNSKSVGIKNNLALEKSESPDQGVTKKKRQKRKRRRKQKSKEPLYNEQNNERENVVPDIASIFASFLASVRDVPRNDEAIKVLEFIADSVNIFRLSLQLIFILPLDDDLTGR